MLVLLEPSFHYNPTYLLLERACPQRREAGEGGTYLLPLVGGRGGPGGGSGGGSWGGSGGALLNIIIGGSELTKLLGHPCSTSSGDGVLCPRE
jgi:hypothetical protein